jgi:hypothetical protein
MPASQWGNVGNAGDTLKHAPLPDLVDVLLASSERVAYLDPFAFALDAPLAPGVGYPRWRADLEARCRARPAYGRLLALQVPRLAAGGAYRCGIGLALDAIGAGRLSWLLTAERDPGLRARLESGLRGMGLSRALVGGSVLADAGLAPTAIAAAGVAAQAGEGLLALIDPFTVRGCPWGAALDGLARAVHRGARAIALAFTYGDHAWPSDLSPADRLYRVRCLREGPFHLAAYATENLAREIRSVLDGFGWS